MNNKHDDSYYLQKAFSIRRRRQSLQQPDDNGGMKKLTKGVIKMRWTGMELKVFDDNTFKIVSFYRDKGKIKSVDDTPEGIIEKLHKLVIWEKVKK